MSSGIIHFRHACVLAALAATVACGGGGSPRNPGGPTKTLTSITIVPGTAAIKLGQSETYTLTATYSDSTSQSVTGTWESDNTSVLTIEGTGRALGVSTGLATVIGRFEGRTVTRLIHVVPDYQGTWSGDYTVTTCTTTGAFDGACGRDAIERGDLLPITVTITQTGTQLTGTMSLGQITGPLTGSLDDGGTFNGTASLTLTSDGVTVATNVSPLRLRSAGERMTGNFRAESTAAGYSGNWVLAGDLRSVTRTSATSEPLLGGGTLPLSSPRDAFRALRIP